MNKRVKSQHFHLFKELFSLPKFIRNSCDLIFVAVGVHILSLALPLTLMQTYDRIIPNRAVGTLIWLLVGCIIALVIEYAFRLIRALISGWMSARFEYHISTLAIDKLLDSTLSSFQKDQPAIHMDRLDSISVLKSFYSGQLLLVLFDLPFSLLFLFAVYFLNSQVIFVPLTFMGLLFLIILVTRISYTKNRLKQNNAINNRVNFLLEMLGGIRMVKGLALEEQMLRRHEHFQSEVTIANMRLAFWNGIPLNIGFTFSQLNMFGVIVVGAEYVISGEMTVGTLTACSMLSARALQPIQSLLLFWMKYSEGKIARDKLQEIAAMEYENPDPEITPLPSNFRGSIEFSQLSYSYPGSDFPVLNDISLQIEENEMISITGDAGRAVDALLMLTYGKLKPTSGKIIIDGYNIIKWDLSQLRGKIEYVPRMGTLFQGTLLDNITLFSPHRKTAALEAAKLMGLDEEVSRLPLGYETETGLHSNSLFPNDLIQRICLARALVTRPGIILFDNAEVTLDPQNLILYQTLLERLKGKTTVIVVTTQELFLNIAHRSFQFEQEQLVERS